MILFNNLRTRLKTALKSNAVDAKNILRVVIGELDQQVSTDDYMVEKIVRKWLKNCRHSMEYVEPGDARFRELCNQIDYLEKLLPQDVDKDTIMGFVLLDEKHLFPRILSAETEARATDHLINDLKTMGWKADMRIILEVVRNIREK